MKSSILKLTISAAVIFNMSLSVNNAQDLSELPENRIKNHPVIMLHEEPDSNPDQISYLAAYDFSSTLRRFDSAIISGILEIPSPGKINTENEINEIFEENLEFENWMVEYNWIDQKEFTESELSFEDWMKYPRNWNIYSCQ